MKVEDEIVVEISWDELGVSDEEEREVCEVMALVGSVDDIWSEIVLSSEENIWSKDGDAGKIWSFDEAIEELSKKIWHFRLKRVSVADSDCDKDDWESIWTEGMFRLGKEAGGDPLINDYWTK